MIGLGGSATVDAGVGILQALGFSFLDKNQREIGAGGAQLLHVESIRTDNILPKLAQCNFELICDVDNPLLGEEGAAKVFGPQKGASAAQVEVLETALSHFAQLTENLLHKSVQNLKYGGAAGGIAAFLHAFINAELKAGTETVLDLLHFNEHLSQNDVVITGEGKLDVQTLNGKGPHGVALRAKHFGKKVIGIAGAIPHEQLHLYNDFDLILSTCNQPMSLEEAMNSAEAFIENTGYKIGQILTF